MDGRHFRPEVLKLSGPKPRLFYEDSIMTHKMPFPLGIKFRMQNTLTWT